MGGREGECLLSKFNYESFETPNKKIIKIREELNLTFELGFSLPDLSVHNQKR